MLGKYTVAVDCWALGCILGELIRGRPLFPGNSTKLKFVFLNLKNKICWRLKRQQILFFKFKKTNLYIGTSTLNQIQRVVRYVGDASLKYPYVKDSDIESLQSNYARDMIYSLEDEPPVSFRETLSQYAKSQEYIVFSNFNKFKFLCCIFQI